MTDPNAAAYPPPPPGSVPPPGYQPGAYGTPVAPGTPAPAPHAGAGYQYPPAPNGYQYPQYPQAPNGYRAPQGPNSYQHPQAPNGYQHPQAPNGYPAPVYGPYGYAPPSGRKFWGLLFLFFVPYLGWIGMLIVAILQRAGARQSPYEIVRENARWAANWALSFMLYITALVVSIIAIGVWTTIASTNNELSGWMAVPGLLSWVVGIYGLVTMIRGAVLSNRVVHRPAFAIPFFRA